MYALLAVIVWSVFTPAAWRWEHPTPQGAPLAALAGDGSAVVAVGGHGSALVSSDGGASWAVASTGVTADLHGVAARGKLVIAVGESGTILRSLDGGASYGVRPAPVAGNFSAVAIGPGGAIHVATREGGTLVSLDGGDSFVAQPGLTTPGLSFGWGAAIVSPAADVVLLGSTSGMFRSADGGETFAPVGGIAEPIGGFASDGGVLYAAGGASVVYATVDICGSCVDAGYAIQSLYRSRDGGKTWEQRVLLDAPGATSAGAAPTGSWSAPRRHVPPSSPPSGSHFGGGFGRFHAPMVTPRFATHDVAVAGGALFVASNGGVLRSDDGGATFGAPLPMPGARLHASGGALVALGNGNQLARSTDRGATWSELSASATDGGNLFAIDALPGGRAIAVGMDGAIVVRDASGGWRARASGVKERLNDVATLGDVVVIVGDRGQILRSRDGGATFSARRSHTVENLNTVWGGDGFFVAAGGDGTVLRSHDGGETWIRLHGLTQDAGIDLWGSSPDDLYLVTVNGQQLRSTDRGETWRDVGAALDGVITGVWGSGPRDVYLVGWGGLIYHSRDRGRTWRKRPSGTDLDLNQIWGRGAGDIYAGGGYSSGSVGILLHSRDRGRTWRPVALPSEATVYALGGDADVTYAVGSGAHIVSRPR